MMMAIKKRRMSRIQDEEPDGMDMMKAESIPGASMQSDNEEEDEVKNPDLAPEVMDRPDDMGEQAKIADKDSAMGEEAIMSSPDNTEESAEELKKLEMMFDPRDTKTRGFSGAAARKMAARIDEIKKGNKI